MDILDTLKKRFSGSTVVIMGGQKPKTKTITKTIVRRSNTDYSKVSSMISKMMMSMMKKMNKQNAEALNKIVKKMPNSQAQG